MRPTSHSISDYHDCTTAIVPYAIPHLIIFIVDIQLPTLRHSKCDRANRTFSLTKAWSPGSPTLLPLPRGHMVVILIRKSLTFPFFDLD